MDTKLNNQTNIAFLLTFLLALPILTTDIYLPSLHAIEYYFLTSPQEVQLSLTLYFLIFGIVQLFYGTLSDHFGRRPMMIISLLLYIFGTTICMLAQTIAMLVCGSCLQAIGAGSAILVFAIIRDRYEGAKAAKMIAYMSSVVALSPIIAPILGAIYKHIYLGNGTLYF